MVGLHDNVSKLWVIRAGGGLDVEGFDDEYEAIERIIRRVLTWSPEGADVATKIRATVEKALLHGQEPAADVSGDAAAIRAHRASCGHPEPTAGGFCPDCERDASMAAPATSPERAELEAAIRAITADMSLREPNGGQMDRHLARLVSLLQPANWATDRGSTTESLALANDAAARFCHALADDTGRLRVAAEAFFGGDFGSPATASADAPRGRGGHPIVTRAQLLEEISARADALRDEHRTDIESDPLVARDMLEKSECAVREAPYGGAPAIREPLLRRSALDCAAWALLALAKLTESGRTENGGQKETEAAKGNHR